MNMEDIARMAREAGDSWDDTLPSDKAFLQRFAKLVAAAEREVVLNDMRRERARGEK